MGKSVKLAGGDIKFEGKIMENVDSDLIIIPVTYRNSSFIRMVPCTDLHCPQKDEQHSHPYSKNHFRKHYKVSHFQDPEGNYLAFYVGED